MPLYLIETRGAKAARTEALVLTKAARLFSLGLSLGFRAHRLQRLRL
jgi:hypothetical protein